jgi:hypothetical protein
MLHPCDGAGYGNRTRLYGFSDRRIIHLSYPGRAGRHDGIQNLLGNRLKGRKKKLFNRFASHHAPLRSTTTDVGSLGPEAKATPIEIKVLHKIL